MSLFAELKRRNVIRVASGYVVLTWLIIQVIETIFPAFGLGDTEIRLAITILAIGFIPTLVFSWVFELTPTGLTKEVNVEREGSIVRFTGKKLDRIIMVLLALGLGYFAFDKFVLDPRRDAELVEATAQQTRSDALVNSAEDRSIAVLPFINMSDDAGNEYFSDGLSEELLNLLTKIPGLKVASRSSAFSYKGKDFKISDVGRELNVAHVLEGSVRKAGDQIRITAQLIKVEDGYHMWSESWDRSLDNIFAIQDEIAAAVAEQLAITLFGNVPQVEKTDPVAYALFLQARHFSNLLTPEGWEQSNALFKQALAIAPDYAAAWAGLSRNYINLAGYNLLPPEEGYRLAREAANQAIVINPETATAYAALGWIAMYHDTDLKASARHFKRALELDPNNLSTIRNAATFCYGLGRLDDAIALDEFSVARDPVNPTGFFNLAQHYTLAGRFDDAIASARTALKLSPGIAGAQYFIGESFLRLGQPKEALSAFEQETDDEWRVKGTALALYDLNQLPEFEEAFAELRERWEDRWPIEIAHVYVWIGDVDMVFPLLEKEAGINGLGGVMVDPFFSHLHEDPRWEPLLTKAGMSKEELDAIEFEVILPQ
jgi:TolB-like protein/lipoprotein NlpI